MGILANKALFLLMMGCLCVFAAPAHAGVKHILVLFPQDGWAVPAYRMVYNGLKSAFSAQAEHQVNLFSENLDLSIFADENKQLHLAEFLRAKYVRNPIDVIVPVGFPALRFVQHYWESDFPGVPFVYCLLTSNELAQVIRGPDITGVALKLDISGTIGLVRRLHPGFKHMAVVAGTGPIDRSLAALTRQAFEAFREQLEWIDLVGLPLEQLLPRVSQLPPSTAILFLTLQRDGEGKNLISADTQKMVSESANAPLYNFIDSAFGFGSVGGRMVSIESNGRKAGELAIRVLNGEKAGTIEPIVLYDNPLMFDWREMKRWGIKESVLPLGSIIHYKEPSLWSSYKGWIAAVLFFVILQTFFIVNLSLNLSKRKKVEKALARSQANLKRAQDIAQIGSFRFDLRRDEVLWSMGAREIYGISADRKIDYDTFLSIVHPDDRQLVDTHWREALKGKEYDIEHRIMRLDEVRWVREKIDFDFDENNRATGGTGIVHDISRHKKLEMETSTLHKELAHVSRVSVIGELGQSLAHEINQPLAAILTNAEAAIRLLSNETPDAEEVREALGDIVADNKRAQNIIKRIRGLVKKSSQTFSLVDINTVVRVAVKLVEGHARERQVDIFLSLTADSTVIKADSIQLQQVLLNLLVNAMEAMDSVNSGYKSIRVTTERLETGIIRLEISDSGSGIDPQSTKSVFDPFFTTKCNGLGLGLSISRSIVELHGGSIAAASPPGQGTTFTIELPVSEARAFE